MRLTDDQIQEHLNQNDGWERREQLITRMFTFENFVEAMAFVNKVADASEELDHHPDIMISYNKVQISVYTHSEGGITKLDFALATAINSF